METISEKIAPGFVLGPRATAAIVLRRIFYVFSGTFSWKYTANIYFGGGALVMRTVTASAIKDISPKNLHSDHNGNCTQYTKHPAGSGYSFGIIMWLDACSLYYKFWTSHWFAFRRFKRLKTVRGAFNCSPSYFVTVCVIYCDIGNIYSFISLVSKLVGLTPIIV